MQSKKPSPDVGKLLTGLYALGATERPTRRAAVSGSTRGRAPAPELSGGGAPGAGPRRSTAVRVGGIVVGQITVAQYRAIQQHIANGGSVDIMFVIS